MYKKEHGFPCSFIFGDYMLQKYKPVFILTFFILSLHMYAKTFVWYFLMFFGMLYWISYIIKNIKSIDNPKDIW